MKIFLFVILFFQIGCGAIANFVIGASGNVFSDEVGRQVEKKINSDCKGIE